jgi:hypothetical protein
VATCSVTWFGNLNNPNLEISDSTTNVSRNAHISTAPPRNSSAAFWQINDGLPLFALTCPINSIVDIEITIIQSDQEGAATTITVSSGVLGKIYYPYLDQLGAGSTKLVPVGLSSTT